MQKGPASTRELERLLSLPDGRVHLVGICGVGMAGLAVLLQSRGLRVSGCDLHPNALSHGLRERGIAVDTPHDPAHLDRGTDWVVRSAAVPEDADELVHARRLGLAVLRRGEVLAAVVSGRDSIAVAGTHGKTTTTTFAVQVLRACGLRPAWCIGGEAPGLEGVAAAGPEEEPLVAEADESDGTLARYAPTTAVVTNIEFDHMEHFDGVDAFEACFRRFAEQARRTVIFCSDDPRAAALCAALPNAVPYGFGEQARFRGVLVEEAAHSVRFGLVVDGVSHGTVRLPVPGRHNVLNALAATAVAVDAGVPLARAISAFPALALPRRRFERVVDRDGVTVLSDYAHHPSEIAALVRTAARLEPRRLLAVFQPHRYTRTRALGAAFPSAFAGVGDLVLTPVYAASEAPLEGGTVWDLHARFRESAEGVRPRVAQSLEQAWAYLRRLLRSGDVCLVVGAGDVETIGAWAREAPARIPVFPADRFAASRVVANAPLAERTTLKVGGACDWWMEPAGRDELARALQWAAAEGVAVTVLGAGSNVVASDLGVRGLVVRLAGRAFRGLRAEGDAVVAGGGLGMSALLGQLEPQGWSGLEFLDGIPGTVGGGMRMNAGAWGHAMAERVLWIRCLNLDGSECIVEKKQVEAGYRECRGLAGKIVLEAAFALERAAPASIAARRAETRARRDWVSGLRCAGSVFRNPPDDYAGRLLESCGLKGMAVGRARFSEAHANVIVTDDGACASDVLALMEIARDRVRRRCGVELQNEVVVLG